MNPNVPPPEADNTVDHANLCAALMTAVMLGDKKKAKSLIKQGADVGYVDNNTRRPLLYQACINEDEPVVKMLIKHWANPNQRSGDGSTAVHAACLTCNTSILARLVDAGGDLRLHDMDGKTPQEWAMKHSDVKRRRRTLNFIDEMHRAAMEDARQLEDEYLQSGKGQPLAVDVPTGLHPRYGSQEKRTSSPSKKKLSSQSNMRNVISVQNLGFGKVRIGGGICGDHSVEPLGHVPLVRLEDLQHDDKAISYCNGPFMVMEGMTWNTIPVTVKRLHRVPIEGACVDLLINENDYMLRLRHSNVLLLMGVCQTDRLQGLVLVYERIITGSLHYVLHHTEELLPLPRIITIFRQVCDALTYVHLRGVVHGLVSSHAIQLVTVNYAKIGNFEYAVDSTKEACHNQQHYAGDLLNIVAPEILNGLRPTTLSDIYGLTVALWEVLHEQVPWSGAAPLSIFHDRLPYGRILPIDELKVASYELCNLLRAGMAHDPLDRPQTPDAFRDWLLSAQKQSPASNTADRVSWMLLPNTHIDKRVNCSSCGSTLLKYNLDQKSKASASPVAAEERPYEQDLVPARKKFQIRNILEQLTISRETKNSLDSRQQQSANRSATDVDKMEGDVENVLLTGAPQERTVASNDVQAPVTAKMDSRDSEIISASSVEFCVAEEFVQPMGAAITRDHLGDEKLTDEAAKLIDSVVSPNDQEVISDDADHCVPVIESVISAVRVSHTSSNERVKKFFTSVATEDVDDAPSAVTRQTVRLTVKQTSDLSERHSASAISSVHDSDTEMHVDRRQSAASVHFKTGSLNMSHSSLQRLAKLREVRQAFFTSDSSSSLVDGDVPPKTNEAGLQQSASDERLHSDVSISVDSVQVDNISVGLEACMQQILSIDELTANDVQAYKDLANKPLPPLPKFYITPVRTEAAFQSEKHGTSSTSDQSVENNDGPGYLRKEGNLFMKASKAGAVGQSALDRDEMTVQESAILSSAAFTISNAKIKQETVQLSRSNILQEAELATAPALSVDNETINRPLSNSSPVASRRLILPPTGLRQLPVVAAPRQNGVKLEGQPSYFPAGLQSYAVSRRGFKPATHCEPSMVVHLPVESASGSNPFLTPPVRRLAPRQLSRYVPLPSAASEGHRIYHAARTPTQSKLAADILPVSAAQLQNELIDSHLTMSNGTPVASQAISGLDSTNPSAESHAENQSVLPGNDSLVSSRHEVSKVKIHDTGATKSDPEMVYIDEPLSEDSAQFVHDVSVISDELMADKQAVMGCDARTNISSRVRDEPQTSDYMKNVAVSITLLDELELEKRHPENIVVKETASAKSNIDGDHETVDIAMAGRAEPITAESRGIVSVSMAAVEEPFSVDSIPMTNVNVAVSVADDSDDFAITVKDVQNPYDSYVSSGHSATELVATASGVQSPVIDLNRASEIPLTSSAGDLIDSLPSLDENGAEDPVLHSVSKGLDHGNLMIVTRDFQTVSQAVQLADQRPEQNGTIDHFINESQSHQSFGEKFSVREINELFASQLSVSVPGNTLADQVTRERVTLDSVTDLRLKVSRASSKSSETWPFPPSDKELNVLGQPDNIPLRKNDEDTLSAKVNVIEDRAEVDGSPSSGAIPKAAKMKYGISEKMFPHATMLDDLDNMQRFKSDPILRFKSYRAYDETVASNVDKTIVLATEQEDYGGLEDARTLQMTAHSLPPLEAAAAKSPPEFTPCCELHKHLLDSAKHGITQLHITAAPVRNFYPVLTHLTDNGQPLLTVRSRGDAVFDKDEMKKSVRAIQHVCIESSNRSSSEVLTDDSCDQDDDSEINTMVEYALRLASEDVASKFNCPSSCHGQSAFYESFSSPV